MLTIIVNTLWLMVISDQRTSRRVEGRIPTRRNWNLVGIDCCPFTSFPCFHLLFHYLEQVINFPGFSTCLSSNSQTDISWELGHNHWDEQAPILF